MKNLISVVVPVYNASKYVSKCIQSIQKQKYDNWELILVDDGSTDNSGDICDMFAEKDGRIRVIHQENQGSVSARRNGVMAAEGEYICFLDADDTMPPTALEALYNAQKQTEGTTVVVGRAARCWNRFILPEKWQPPCFRIAAPVVFDHDTFISELYCSWFGISNMPVSLGAKLYPAKLLKDTFAAVPDVVEFMGDDLIMTLDLMPKAENVVIVPDVVYHYRPGGGTSKFQPQLLNDWLALYRFKAKYAEKYPMPQPIEKLMDVELCNMIFTYFEMLQAHGKLSGDTIRRVWDIAEVKKAANNTEINPEFIKATLLREKMTDEILAFVKPNGKSKLKHFIKQIYYKMA